MDKCNICILTYRRPKLLMECLASLERIETVLEVEILVTVIENDSEQSTLPSIQAYADKSSLPIVILCEPAQGIPIARNTAIDYSLKWGADFIVFIDDDEIVDPMWFANLYSYCKSHDGSAVIHGEVVAVYPKGTPDHISGLFKTKKRPTGMALSSCATNNVIFPISLVKDLGLRFDTSVPLAGGTDTKFFTVAATKGIQIFQCAEAIVYETVSESRATLKWMTTRKYRAGITDAWHDRYNGKSWLVIFVKAIFQLITNVIRLFLLTVINRKIKRNLAILKIGKSVGIIAGLFGFNVESYSVSE